VSLNPNLAVNWRLTGHFWRGWNVVGTT